MRRMTIIAIATMLASASAFGQNAGTAGPGAAPLAAKPVTAPPTGATAGGDGLSMGFNATFARNSCVASLSEIGRSIANELGWWITVLNSCGALGGTRPRTPFAFRKLDVLQIVATWVLSMPAREIFS